MLESEDETMIFDMYTLVNEMGDYYLQELLCRRLCEIDSDDLGYRNRLALAVLAQGRYGEAEDLLRQCLEVITTEGGEDDPYTLVTMNNLARA
eukprot:13084342-Ditylum_brightwellii.AAC.1